MTREYKVIFSPIFSHGRRATIYGLFSRCVSFSSNQFILALSFFSFLLFLSVYVNRGFIIFIKNNWREFHCGHFRPLPPWSLDHLRIVLVSKLLNGDTYDTWESFNEYSSQCQKQDMTFWWINEEAIMKWWKSSLEKLQQHGVIIDSQFYRDWAC